MNNIQPKTLFIGKNYVYLPSCHSTNDFAAEMIQNKDIYDGTIVITSNQTAGRGQRGNSWETLPGQNLTLSIILKPSFLTANEQFKLNITISLAVYDFLNKYLDSDSLKIKWPNDIYFNNKKMGGILIENTLFGTQIATSIVGIGLNINQLNFDESKAISLRSILRDDEFDLEKLVSELCENIEGRYLALRNNNTESQKVLYLRKLFRFQEKHIFMKNDTQFEGQIIGIDKIGQLGLEINGEIQYFGFKEITFIV